MAITKNITIRSVNGPENTIILGAAAASGGTGAGAVRCVFMTKGNLYGFALSNGFTLEFGNEHYNQSGGGIWLTNGCIVTNCIISGNNADWYGGGVYCYSGGSISDCSISGNSADYGGGIYCDEGSVSDCTISGNNADFDGGGVFCIYGSVSDCTISGNSAENYGGGFYVYRTGSLTNCLIYGLNSAMYGGGAYLKTNNALYNCTIAGNYASAYGGGICTTNGGTWTNLLTGETGNVPFSTFNFQLISTTVIIS